MNSILYFLTQALAGGITLAKVAVRSVLPNLYLKNKRDDQNIPLIYSGNYPYFYPEAYGEYLDRIGSAFNVTRLERENDFSYRERILFSLQKNATISGVEQALKVLFEYTDYTANVQVVENKDYFFDAESTNFDVPLRDPNGSMFYQVTIFVEPSTNTQNFNKPVYSTYLEDIFNVSNVQLLLDDILAAGIKVDAIIIKAPGAGGEKGDFYVNSN